MSQWPIKFNGMAFVAAMGNHGEPDSRSWGPSNWCDVAVVVAAVWLVWGVSCGPWCGARTLHHVVPSGIRVLQVAEHAFAVRRHAYR